MHVRSVLCECGAIQVGALGLFTSFPPSPKPKLPPNPKPKLPPNHTLATATAADHISQRAHHSVGCSGCLYSGVNEGIVKFFILVEQQQQ